MQQIAHISAHYGSSPHVYKYDAQLMSIILVKASNCRTKRMLRQGVLLYIPV